MRFPSSFSIPLGLVLFSACGGASLATFPDASYTGDGDIDAGSNPGSSSGGEPSATNDASVDSGGSTGDDARTYGDGSLVDTGGPQDAGVDAVDAGPGILCPEGAVTSYCPSTQACCITQVMSTPFGMSMQVTGCASGCSGAIVQCAAQADCPPTQVCCGTENIARVGYDNVTCQSSCMPNFMVNKTQFCDPLVDVCPSGMNCLQSTILAGYSVCQ